MALLSGVVNQIRANNASPPAPGSQGSYNQALGANQAAAAPSFAQIDLQQANQRTQLGLLQAQLQLANQQAGQDAGFANRQFGVDQQRLAAARAAQENPAYYDALTTMARNKVNFNLGNLGNLHASDLNYYGSLTDLANQLYGLQNAQANQQYNQGVRAEQSQVAGMGASGSEGYRQHLGDLSTQLQQTLQGNTLTNERSLTDLGHQREQSDFGYEGSTRNLQYDVEKEIFGYQHQKEMNAGQLGQLDAQAAQYGLNRDQTLASINQGLQKLQINSAISANDLMTALQSGDFQRQQVAEGIVRQAIQQSGYVPPVTPPPISSHNTGSATYGKAQ